MKKLHCNQYNKKFLKKIKYKHTYQNLLGDPERINKHWIYDPQTKNKINL